MKRIKTPTTVTTVVLTLITIIFWVAFEIYRAFTLHPAPSVPVEIVKPLNPVLDLTALNKLQQKLELSDDQIGNNAVTEQTPQPTTIPTIAPVATNSATASPSATLTP